MNKISMFLLIALINISVKAQNMHKDIYKLKTCTVIQIIGCGSISYAYAYKFIHNRRCIIAIIKCPNLYGDNYFIQNRYYEIKEVKDSTYKCNYADVIANQFEKENLPTIYVDKIKRISKY